MGIFMKTTPKNPLLLIKDDNLHKLHGKKKIQYIWDYYKLPLVILGIFLYVITYALYNHFSHKDTVLYTALVNVNAGESLTEGLGADFLDYLELDASQNKLELYTGLYLTYDEHNPYHEYTYASRMKILASIEGELLDVALMNQEAFDAFSQNGYLCDLEEFLSQADADLYNSIKSDFADNIVILEDNAIELQLDASIPYHAITEEHPFGVDLSHTWLMRQAGFEETVYLGIIANSPRKDAAVAYLRYLFSM